MLENYSEKARKALKNVKIGDRISVSKADQTYVGLLMPRSDVGDKDCIVIKLDNGYNVGVRVEGKVKIEKLEPKLSKATFSEKVADFDASKPKISMITTGGTIISRVDYKTGGTAPLEKPEDLLANVPELKDIIFLDGVSTPFKKASEDLDYKNWQKLAEMVASELKSSKGVIIAHGTDTMHYTSAALSFMLKNLGKPVVFVGSQRSSDRGSSDAAMNLICAAHTAISDIAEVGICMHATTDDHYCYFTRGTKARKMHSSRRDAFRSINEMPLAKVLPNGKIDMLNSNYRKRSDEKVVADTKFEPKVALVKAYPGSEPGIMEYLAKKGYKGFVIEGTGLGHVPTDAEKSWIPAIKKMTKEGIPVVITTQTLYGRVNTNVYTNLRILFNDAKAIPGEDMLPEVAYVKLGWVLGHTKDMEEIRKMMLTNIAGEITQRSELDAFLV
jgi:glutamyl-tRNA(Gln) amidotransferase subunit D